MNKKLKAKIYEIYGTQADFTIAICSHESVVSRVVRGRNTLTLDSQKKWAKVLKCKRKDIFG